MRTTHWLVALAALVPAIAAHAAEIDIPRGEYSRYRIRLDAATEEGKPMVLHLHTRDGKLGSGWVTSASGAGQIVSHTLRRQGDRLVGEVKVLLDAVTYTCAIDVMMEGRRGVGDYSGEHGTRDAGRAVEGTVTGRTVIPAGPDRPLRLRLDLVSMFTEHGWMRDPSFEVTVKDGKVTGGRFFSRAGGGRGFEGDLEGGSARVIGGRLKAALRGTVTGGDAAKGTFEYMIDEPVLCNHVQGSYRAKRRDEDWGRHPFSGHVRGLASDDADDRVAIVTLADAIEGDRDMTLYVRHNDGQVVRAIARGGNLALHEVDAKALDITGDGLEGEANVTIQPTRRWPPGERSVFCRYDLKVGRNGKELAGHYGGQYGVKRPVHGNVRAAHLEEQDLWRQWNADAE